MQPTYERKNKVGRDAVIRGLLLVIKVNNTRAYVRNPFFGNEV